MVIRTQSIVFRAAKRLYNTASANDSVGGQEARVKLVLNGEPFEQEGDRSLEALLHELGADGNRVATMLNDEIVEKRNRPLVKLQDGDRVEVLAFAGGGAQ